MENPIKIDDLGVPLFFGNTHIPHTQILLLHVLSVGGDSLTKPPFRVTSAEVVIICPNRMTANDCDCLHMSVSKNTAIPKWMVYNGKPY